MPGLQRSSRTLLIAGIALVVLGSIAIIALGLATLVVAKFLAWLLIVSAIAEFYLAFQVHGGWRIAGRSSPGWSRWSPASGCS